MSQKYENGIVVQEYGKDDSAFRENFEYEVEEKDVEQTIEKKSSGGLNKVKITVPPYGGLSTQADWAETDEESPAFIWNKPEEYKDELYSKDAQGSINWSKVPSWVSEPVEIARSHDSEEAVYIDDVYGVAAFVYSTNDGHSMWFYTRDELEEYPAETWVNKITGAWEIPPVRDLEDFAVTDEALWAEFKKTINGLTIQDKIEAITVNPNVVEGEEVYDLENVEINGKVYGILDDRTMGEMDSSIRNGTQANPWIAPRDGYVIHVGGTSGSSTLHFGVGALAYTMGVVSSGGRQTVFVTKGMPAYLTGTIGNTVFVPVIRYLHLPTGESSEDNTEE